MLNTVSLFFPAGETFFIESVRHYQPRILDPVLREQVQAFVFQEVMHTRQHRAVNRLLGRYYANAPAVEALARRHLGFWQWLLPHSVNLAVTCAIEHLTAIAARTLLQYQAQWEVIAEPGFYRLWMWHAVEEAEHKAVCFDVYRAVSGSGPWSYFVRCTTMVLTSVLFLATLAVGMAMLGRRPPVKAAVDDRPASPTARGRPARFFRRGLLALLRDILPWRHYFAYFRPGFHPSDFDCESLIEEWKARFPDLDEQGVAAPDAAAVAVG